jgi:hypothetical protein
MSTLADRINARLADLDAEEARVGQAAKEAVATIAGKKAALQKALLLATPEAEAALNLLAKLGVINPL